MTNKIKGFQDTIEWYNKNAKKYASSIKDIASYDLLDKFANAVGKGAKVLDAGCAAGRDCKLLKDRNLTPIGIDLSEPLLIIARKKYPNIEFKQANFLNLPFEDAIFDGVWAHASLLHLETIKDVLKALKEFYRVLKPNGIIHVLVKQQQGKEKTTIISDKISGHDRFFQWFTKDEIKSLLEKVGFTIQKIQDEYKDPAGRKDVKWIIVLAKK